MGRSTPTSKLRQAIGSLILDPLFSELIRDQWLTSAEVYGLLNGAARKLAMTDEDFDIGDHYVYLALKLLSSRGILAINKFNSISYYCFCTAENTRTPKDRDGGAIDGINIQDIMTPPNSFCNQLEKVVDMVSNLSNEPTGNTEGTQVNDENVLPPQETLPSLKEGEVVQTLPSKEEAEALLAAGYRFVDIAIEREFCNTIFNHNCPPPGKRSVSLISSRSFWFGFIDVYQCKGCGQKFKFDTTQSVYANGKRKGTELAKAAKKAAPSKKSS